MNSIVPNLDSYSNMPLYVQLYEYIKQEILSGRIKPFEKLPSIRALSNLLNLSKTTVESAYDQLLTEGYIYSKPQSGYYINNIIVDHYEKKDHPTIALNTSYSNGSSRTVQQYTDMSSFDFIKWKKCLNQVLTDKSEELLYEASPRGEETLRHEICRYVYQSRGVVCDPDQIVIGAGTQQIMNLLCIMLENIDIKKTAFENPGYYPARKIFSDRGFQIHPVSIEKDGLNIEELKKSGCDLVYVSPSHQFPLGTVMSIAKRYELLEWAYGSDCIIIEDDYDSELRYLGRPVPSLQSLDKRNKVIYLGSFSTTLLPSIKISYMILPNQLLELYKDVMKNYNQTCSKIEQLTLAFYMKEGFYQKQIKKLRNLYANKVQVLLDSLEQKMKDYVKVISHDSGLHVLLEVDTRQSSQVLCERAAEVKIHALPIEKYMITKKKWKKPILLLYYSQIPLEEIPSAIDHLKRIWQN